MLVQLFSLEDHGLVLIDKVPSGLPTPVAPQWDGIRQLVPGAFAIALMVFLETAAVARSVRRRSEPPIDNNQELVASGLACAAGAFFRAMPAAGGFSQTAINQKAGARTQLSELVTVSLAVACALFLGGVLSNLPEATLACVVVIAVLGLVDLQDFVRYWKFSRIVPGLLVLRFDGPLHTANVSFGQSQDRRGGRSAPIPGRASSCSTPPRAGFSGPIPSRYSPDPLLGELHAQVPTSSTRGVGAGPARTLNDAAPRAAIASSMPGYTADRGVGLTGEDSVHRPGPGRGRSPAACPGGRDRRRPRRAYAPR